MKGEYKEECDMINQTLQKGKLEITGEVISMIILMCIKDIDDVEIISHIKDDLRGIFYKRYYKGVLIDNSDEDLNIVIKLEITNPKDMIEMCIKIQRMLINEIKQMTGILIKNITIQIEKVQIK